MNGNTGYVLGIRTAQNADNHGKGCLSNTYGDAIMDNAEYKILLVEDDELDQMAFKRFVEQSSLPYDCTIAASVTEARSVLAERRFDVVVSDYSLGDGTAFDILGLVKDTPTILVTGAGDQEVAIKAWKAGACDYLIKDIDRNYLKTVPITIENAIRHSETEKKVQLLSGAVMSTDDSVYITDMEGSIIFVNRAFCETYGYTEEEIIGKDSDLLWMGSGRSDNAENVFQGASAGSSWASGFYHKRKDRSIFPISLSRSGIKDSNGDEIAVVGIARDISELILVEEELRRANAELSERIRQNSELAYMALDALNRALTGAQIDRAKSIADDFLTIARIDTGRMELERTEFDFAAVVRRTVEALSSSATERGIKLISSLPDGQLPINADWRRIDRVLRNLIKQAVVSVRPNGHITVGVEDTDSQIAVTIEYDGSVVDNNRMQNIFDRSGWTKEQLAQWQNDLTLGLPIAREMVEMHGGCLWAESGDDQGNTVCFTLPKSRALVKRTSDR